MDSKRKLGSGGALAIGVIVLKLFSSGTHIGHSAPAWHGSDSSGATNYSAILTGPSSQKAEIMGKKVTVRFSVDNMGSSDLPDVSIVFDNLKYWKVIDVTSNGLDTPHAFHHGSDTGWDFGSLSEMDTTLDISMVLKPLRPGSPSVTASVYGNYDGTGDPPSDALDFAQWDARILPAPGR